MFTSQQFQVLSFGDIDVDLWYKSTHPLQNVRYIFSPVLLVLQWMQTRVSSYYSRYSFCCFHFAASLVGLLLGPIYNIALHRRARAECTPVQHWRMFEYEVNLISTGTDTAQRMSTMELSLIVYLFTMGFNLR